MKYLLTTLIALTVMYSHAQTTDHFLNEAWIAPSEHLLSENHTSFYSTGRYESSASDVKGESSYYGYGTYHYQPETNELFVHVERSGGNSVTAEIEERCDYKIYFKVESRSDTTITVSAFRRDIDWTVDENGTYRLCNSHNLLPAKETYQRIKL